MIAMFGNGVGWGSRGGKCISALRRGEADCGADDMPSGPQPQSHLVDMQ